MQRNRPMCRLSQVLAVAAFFVLPGAMAASTIAAAQTFPSKAVKIVVPAAAGGALDTISRLMAQKASEIWKQPVIIENRPGANWIIGMQAVARAAPDGYTLLFVASSGLTINPHVFSMPLDPMRDLVPVTTATHNPFVLLLNPKVPARTVGEFVAYLRANPQKLNHASNSATTMMVSELFKSQAKVEYVDVNYRGASEAIGATIAGITQFCFVDLGSGTPSMQGKTLHPLALTSHERYELNPDIPTMVEQSLPGSSATTLTLLLAPANTPQDLVKSISAVFQQALQSPDVKAKLNGMGQVVVGGTSEQALRALQPEAEQWAKLIKERNIKFGQ